MSHFSRLTDIVTCNLTALLAEAEDPQSTLREIISEMEEGMAGANRSAATAAANEERIRNELDEHREQITNWTNKAKDELSAGHEDRARQSLSRKQEIEDLIAGLEQHHKAAVATRDHMNTTLRALDARLADARRRQFEWDAGPETAARPTEESRESSSDFFSRSRTEQIDVELAALKRELEDESHD